MGIADAGIGQLEAVAFSPDGRGLAVGGQHGAQLWSIAGTAGPTRQRTLDGGATAVTSLAYSQGGRRLLLSSDGTGQTWDVANPSQPSQAGYFAPGAPLLQAVTPVGESAVAAATEDGQILTWTSVDPAVAPSVMVRGLGPFADLAATRDGRHLYVADTTGTVKSYNVEDITRPRLEAALPHTGTVGDLATSPDGTRLLVGHGEQATLWDITNPEKPVQLTVLGQHTGQVAGVALAPDNRSAVTVGARSAILWDLSEPTKPTYVASLFDNTNIVSAAAYSPDSSTVATASWDGTARLWNVDELRAYRTGDLRPVEAGDTTLPDAGSITGAVLSPDAQTLLTTNIDGTNRLWDLHDPATVRPRGSLPTGTGDVAFNNDATTLIAAQTGTNPSVSVWGLPDLASPQRLATLGSGPVDALALSGDGRRAVTTAGSTATLWNLDVVIGPEQAGTIHDDKPITAATYTPDGKTLVLGHDSGDISVWAVADPTRPAKTRTLTGPARPVEHIALTADGTRAVSVNQGGGVAAWNLADAAPRPAATMQPSGHGTEAAWLTPAADLALLADDDDPGTLWSWRSPNGPQRWLTLPYRHVGPLPSMLSADATTAVTVSSQGGLTIWTLRSILAVVDNPRQRACELTQGLTQEQWRHAVGAVPYRATC